jgi:hypothetical protein
MFWLSWLITAEIIVAISVIFLEIGGMIFQFGNSLMKFR